MTPLNRVRRGMRVMRPASNRLLWMNLIVSYTETTSVEGGVNRARHQTTPNEFQGGEREVWMQQPVATGPAPVPVPMGVNWHHVADCWVRSWPVRDGGTYLFPIRGMVRRSQTSAISEHGRGERRNRVRSGGLHKASLHNTTYTVSLYSYSYSNLNCNVD